MLTKPIFFLENSGISVLMHLVVVAVMITSFARIPDKIIAPERIKIMDIDLSQVKISNEKTKANAAAESKPAAAPKGKGEPKKPSEPAPVVRTVSVQRDSAPIHRVVNVSVIDALRIAMTRCWQIDTNIPGLEEFIVSAHLTMARGGFVRELWIENEAALNDYGTGSYVLDTVRAAIADCQPFSMLPDEDFDTWKSIKLNFFPHQGSVN